MLPRICPIYDAPAWPIYLSSNMPLQAIGASASAAAFKQSGHLSIQEEVALIREVTAFARFLCEEHSAPALDVVHVGVTNACRTHIAGRLSTLSSALQRPGRHQGSGQGSGQGSEQGSGLHMELCRHLLAVRPILIAQIMQGPDLKNTNACSCIHTCMRSCMHMCGVVHGSCMHPSTAVSS
jgi:hypothetical protein